MVKAEHIVLAVLLLVFAVGFLTDFEFKMPGTISEDLAKDDGFKTSYEFKNIVFMGQTYPYEFEKDDFFDIKDNELTLGLYNASSLNSAYYKSLKVLVYGFKLKTVNPSTRSWNSAGLIEVSMGDFNNYPKDLDGRIAVDYKMPVKLTFDVERLTEFDSTEDIYYSTVSVKVPELLVFRNSTYKGVYEGEKFSPLVMENGKPAIYVNGDRNSTRLIWTGTTEKQTVEVDFVVDWYMLGRMTNFDDVVEIPITFSNTGGEQTFYLKIYRDGYLGDITG